MQRLFKSLFFLKPECVFIKHKNFLSGITTLPSISSTSCFKKCYTSQINTVLNSSHKHFFPVFDSTVRYATVFTSVSSTDLWLGVTGAQGSTKKRARGKRRVKRQKINLNFGQKIGKGKSGMKFPGLNESLFTPRGWLKEIKEGAVDKDYFDKLDVLRQKFSAKKKKQRISPLARGWTGSRLAGQSLGPPSPEFGDFDSRILEGKVVATMNATVGRLRRFSIFVAVGNGRGLCGVAKASAVNCVVACRVAKQRAYRNLVFFDLKEGRTLWHNGYAHEWGTKIFIKPRAEGGGVTAHRVISTICKLVGVKDMYAKVEGSTTNYQVIARGFLRMLAKQENYQMIANRLNLHVVEFTPDRDMFPHVLASPSCGHTVDLNAFDNAGQVDTNETKTDELSLIAISHPDRRYPRKPKPEQYTSLVDDLVNINDENTTSNVSDMELILAGERNINVLALKGRVPSFKRIPLPGYLKNPGNLKRAAERHRYRNHDASKLERLVYSQLHEN